MRLRLDPVPTLMIFDENSTPMVCEESTRPAGRQQCLLSSGQPAGRRAFASDKPVQQAGSGCVSQSVGLFLGFSTTPPPRQTDSLPASARPQQYDLRQVVVHAPELLSRRCQRQQPGCRGSAYRTWSSGALLELEVLAPEAARCRGIAAVWDWGCCGWVGGAESGWAGEERRRRGRRGLLCWAGWPLPAPGGCAVGAVAVACCITATHSPSAVAVSSIHSDVGIQWPG